MNAAIISREPINPQDAIHFCSLGSAGGSSIFIGSVRDQNRGKKVIGLHYQAYDPMVLKEMEKAISMVRSTWKLERVYLAHRHGDLQIGDVAILVACSSVHRKEAIEATSWLIETLKKTLPIWKKEIYEDGSEWLNSGP